MLIKLIQNHVRIGVPAKLHDKTHTFPVGFIPCIHDSVNLFGFYKLGNYHFKVILTDHIG